MFTLKRLPAGTMSMLTSMAAEISVMTTGRELAILHGRVLHLPEQNMIQFIPIHTVFTQPEMNITVPVQAAHSAQNHIIQSAVKRFISSVCRWATERITARSYSTTV